MLWKNAKRMIMFIFNNYIEFERLQVRTTNNTKIRIMKWNSIRWVHFQTNFLLIYNLISGRKFSLSSFIADIGIPEGFYHFLSILQPEDSCTTQAVLPSIPYCIYIHMRKTISISFYTPKHVRNTYFFLLIMTNIIDDNLNKFFYRSNCI